jgi:ligand-binding sensor domain-containing protein/signal transduction histidine kinase
MRALRHFIRRSCRGGVFLAAFLCSLHAAEVSTGSPFLQRSWQTDQGLPHDSVTAILQTSDGFLWVGTRRGLARFDGVRFTTVDALGDLRIDCIYSLFEDSHNNLWIATERGVFRFGNGILSHFDQSDGLAENRARTFCESRDGSIWIGTAGGLSQYRNNQFINYTEREGLGHRVVRGISEDNQGTLWIATDAALCELKDGVVSVLEMPREWAQSVRVVCVDRQNNVWVGTQIGLCRKKENGWEFFDKSRYPLSDNYISTLHCDKAGRLWIGTYSGLNWMENGTFHTELTAEGASYDLVNVVCEDREGDFWVGSKEGLTRLKRRLFTPVAQQQGLTYNNVMSVLQTRAGMFYAATWGGGMFEIQQTPTNVFTRANLLPSYRTLALCETRDGSLWCSTDHGAGLFRFKDGTKTEFGESHGLERVGIPVMFEDHETNFWIGTARSLSLFRDNRFVRFTSKDGLASDTVKVIYEDHQNNLWIGTTGGLSRRTNGTFSNLTTTNGLSHNVVLSLYQDMQNDLWIGTGGGGLNRMRNGKFTIYSTQQGLFNDEILDILEDDDGNLWMSTLKGVFRVSKKAFDSLDRKEIATLPCASYGKEEGMTSIICCNVAKPAAWKADDGRLWFATTKGVAIAEPKMKVNQMPPPIVVEAVFVDKKKIPNGGSSTLVIPPGRGELEIHFTALSFVAPEKNRFKYKLAGYDSDWLDVGSRRFAYYNNLPPGEYRFEVMAANNDGLWATLKAPVALKLQPHWWQTWSFRGLVILSSFSAVSLGARSLTKRRMQRKLQELERQHAVEKERARIARDMHDDLGACLTQILFLSDVARKNKAQPEIVDEQVSRISKTTHEVVRNLDGIVWAVNPENDTLERFAAYLEEYVGVFLQSTDIRCRFTFPEQLPACSLSSEIRHNLFLVMKEALNNATKYSHATEIRLELKLAKGKLSLALEDNGKGFNQDEVSSFGNGLRNMEERVRSFGGCFELESEPGKGTRIQIHLSLPSKVRACSRV